MSLRDDIERHLRAYSPPLDTDIPRLADHLAGNLQVIQDAQVAELERAVRRHPDRYIGEHDAGGNLVGVHDLDAGRLWRLIGHTWCWME
jgi:hypothetical protein